MLTYDHTKHTLLNFLFTHILTYDHTKHTLLNILYIDAHTYDHTKHTLLIFFSKMLTYDHTKHTLLNHSTLMPTSSHTKHTLLNLFSQMPTYDHTKHTLLNLGWMQEGPRLHVACSILAGLMCAVTTTPVDVIKTRLMNQKYKGTFTSSSASTRRSSNI